MTSLHPETLAQLTTVFATNVKTVGQDTTTQLVYVALAELGERRKLDTALVGVVNAAKTVVDGALDEHQTSSAFELSMARLELALLDLDELRAPAVPTEPADADAQRLATAPEV